ncbi:hypothetical protein BU16DRAFT_561301 [Lophium mytilinum]|uniref:Uncharacterized protein n=1 Tax=Lophium mytilinum TaxID=390894 RepID=A0A6A6QW99_9PEZI|nr:hypothetical protein BU16DRAFT_561301 [Lophium mytilinum]
MYRANHQTYADPGYRTIQCSEPLQQQTWEHQLRECGIISLRGVGKHHSTAFKGIAMFEITTLRVAATREQSRSFDGESIFPNEEDPSFSPLQSSIASSSTMPIQRPRWMSSTPPLPQGTQYPGEGEPVVFAARTYSHHPHGETFDDISSDLSELCLRVMNTPHKLWSCMYYLLISAACVHGAKGVDECDEIIDYLNLWLRPMCTGLEWEYVHEIRYNFAKLVVAMVRKLEDERDRRSAMFAFGDMVTFVMGFGGVHHRRNAIWLHAMYMDLPIVAPFDDCEWEEMHEDQDQSETEHDVLTDYEGLEDYVDEEELEGYMRCSAMESNTTEIPLDIATREAVRALQGRLEVDTTFKGRMPFHVLDTCLSNGRAEQYTIGDVTRYITDWIGPKLSKAGWDRLIPGLRSTLLVLLVARAIDNELEQNGTLEDMVYAEMLAFVLRFGNVDRKKVVLYLYLKHHDMIESVTENKITFAADLVG